MFTRDRGKYIDEVVKYVEQQLEVLNVSLPATLKIESVTGAQSDWHLQIHVNTSVVDDKWFDFFDVLSALAEKVNERFKQDEWYFRVVLLMPERLMGERGIEHLKTRNQREVENDEFRKVRLRKNNG